MEPKNLYFVDIHTHYELIPKEIIKEKFKENNIISLTNSTNYSSYIKLEELRKEKIPNLYFAYGLYPGDVLEHSYLENKKMLEKIDFNKAQAIGEIGIDYKFTKDKDLRKLQEDIFREQLNIAEKLNKPVIVHSRFASKIVLEILKEYKLKVLLHWFDGSEKNFKKAIEKGYYISLNYDRNSYINKDLSSYINNIFLETDYPIPYNNKKSEITDIKKVYDLFCKKQNIDLKDLKIQLQDNFYRFFS